MGHVLFPSNTRFFRILALLLPTLVAPLYVAGAGEPGATFAGVNLSVASPTVPPGGLLQMQVSITEPKPILKGRQGLRFATASAALAATSPFGVSAAAAKSPLGAIRDAALFSPRGDVSGVLVSGTSGAQVFFTSPLTSFGGTIDTPVIAIAIPVNKTAIVGQTQSLALDPNNALWYDPNSHLYPMELNSGTLKVGGTLSISDVTPGAGTVKAGTLISIRGTGFRRTSVVKVNEGTITTFHYVSPNLIQITLALPLNIRGTRIRVTNDNNEKVTYYPYQRTTLIGKSARPLIAASFPLFSESKKTVGYFRPVLQGTVFTGFALQNLNSSTATVVVQLSSQTGAVLAKKTLQMATKTSIARSLAEYFPGVKAATGTRLKVSSNQAIQILGLLGDDAARSVLPVNPSSTP